MITLAPLLDALLGAGPIARTVESLRSADVADVAVAPGAWGWAITLAPQQVSRSAVTTPPCMTPLSGSPTKRAS